MQSQGLFITETKYRLNEPLTPSVLTKLAAALPVAKSGETKFQISVLLYRYKTLLGKNYLATLNSKGDLRASSLFALIKETDQKASVIKNLVKSSALVKDGNDDIYIPWYMVRALGEWKDPQISDALLKSYKNMPEDSFLAMALAHQENKNAISLHRKGAFRITRQVN